METSSRMAQMVHFLGQLWRNKAVVRSLLGSENYVFVRDYPPGHFYSAIPDLQDFRRYGAPPDLNPVETLGGVALRPASQSKLLQGFASYYPSLPFSAHASQEFRYYLDNPFFSFGDGIILYSMLRHFEPRRVVEIGSGYSSAAMLDTSEKFLHSGLEFTFVDPFPERLYGLLRMSDRARCRIEVKPVQEVDGGIFRALRENDILFVDSSHVAKTCSDLVHILFNILPTLNPGVLVHFHDVPWPFEYPQQWINGGRAWNEAYFLRSFLQYNTAFEIVYFNDYMARCHTSLVNNTLPLSLNSSSFSDTLSNTSLWLRKLPEPSA
jgi:predicted O-methyltransferase YrrM